MKQSLTLLTVLFSATTFAQNVGIGTTIPTDQFHTTGSVRFQKYTGPTTRLAQIDSSGRLVATSAGAVFSNTTPQSITDNGCATGVGVNSSITISGQPNVPIQSSRIAVKVNITHSYVADLRIYLFPPSVNVLVLASANGGGGVNFTNTIFTDQAPSSISTGVAPFSGQYKPIGGAASCTVPNTAVSTFSAIGSGTILPNGTWTLKVIDAAGGDVGTLNDWSISFTGPESITTADENNFIPKLVGGNFVASNIYQPAGSSNIGIGTTNPLAKLDINGQIKITGGTPGVGKLLESDATGLATWSDKSASFLPTGASGNMLRHTGVGWTANSLLYNNGINIGIGTTAPSYILDINGRARLRHNGATSGMWYNKADNTEAAFAGMFNDSTYGYFGANGWTAGFDVKNGQLGIGTLDPTAALSFSNTLGNKINLFGDATTPHYGIGIQGSLMQLYSGDFNADIAFGYGRSATFIEAMRIKGNGKVGIGTNPTNYTLEVKNQGFGSNTLLLESAANLGNAFENRLTFKSNNYYTGAIKAIGTSATTARLGFFTGANASEGNLLERMSITNDGNVGIGIFNPTYPLHIEDVTLTSNIRELAYFRNESGIAASGGGFSIPNSATATLASFSTSFTTGGEFGATSSGSSTGVDAFANGANTTYAIFASTTSFGGNLGGTRYAAFFSGNVNYTGTLTNTSDATLKTNIKPFENALTSINKLKVKQYEYTADSKKTIGTSEGEHIGVLAQELQQVFPTLVSKQIQPLYENVKDEKGIEKRTQTGSKEYLGVNYMELIPVLIKGMQEQQVQIEELKKKIEILEKK
jgi:subtilisin-like proprotein convertase family protein